MNQISINRFPFSSRRSFFVSSGVFLASLLLLSALRGQPPYGWPPNAFEPVTLERIEALPTTEVAAWNAYWQESERRQAAVASQREVVLEARAKGETEKEEHHSGAAVTRGIRLRETAEWYRSAEAAALASRIVDWQSAAGGWQKGIDYRKPYQVSLRDTGVWGGGTIDNNAIYGELSFLARIISANPNRPETARWKGSFERGFDYLFAAQYPNGGFPQVYPLAGGYHDAITLNDDAMSNVLKLLRDLSEGDKEYAFASETLRSAARHSLDRGVACVLSMQQVDDEGRLTIWAQQYDALTLEPCAARNFEPIAEATGESSEMANFLMTLSHPSPELVASVEGAVSWMERSKLVGVQWGKGRDGHRDLIQRANAKPLWARYYKPRTLTPIFGDRDRTVHFDVKEISDERRDGYAWYGDWPASALKRYERWREKLNRKR